MAVRTLWAMNGKSAERLSRADRLRAMRHAYQNAAAWAVGNGLASSSLVVYLAQEFGATGLAVSLILATPQWVGLLRLGTPVLLPHVGSRKRFCVVSYVASAAVLGLLPFLSMFRVAISPAVATTLLVGLWSTYHLLEYVGTVALWSWLGDIAPERIRGRFIGVRERWLLVGRIGGVIGGGGFIYLWRNGWEAAGIEASPYPIWIGYGVMAGAGALAMFVSVLPLVLMRDVPLGKSGQRVRPLGNLMAPFRDRRFLRLLLFGCWFSFSNGITQAAQFTYLSRVLQLELFWLLMFQTGMRLGQSGIAPSMGRLADRFGNRPVMVGAQLLGASGPLFFFWASGDAPWWVAGAYVVWIAYAGLNVCLPNLTLKLAPRRESASYMAAYFAVGGLFYGASTVAGGVLLDWLDGFESPLAVGPYAWDAHQLIFAVGTAARAMGVLLLLGVIEPGAWSWRRILAREA